MIYKMIAINATNSSKHFQIKWRQIEIRQNTIKSQKRVCIGYGHWQCIPNIDVSKKEVIGNSISATKDFNREGPDERVEIEEDVRIVK